MKKSRKYNIYAFILIVIGLLIFVYYDTNRSNKEIKQNRERYKNFNFSGLVINKKHLVNGSCLVKLNLSQTNIKDHDPRDDSDNIGYLCVIKYPLAEMIVYCSYVDVGDSISLIDNTVSIFKDGKMKEQYIHSTFFIEINMKS